MDDLIWFQRWFRVWFGGWYQPLSGQDSDCSFGAYTIPPATKPFGYTHRLVRTADFEVPLYVIGWAYDGECARSWHVTTMDEVDNRFAGLVVHRERVQAGQTSFDVTLPIAPQGWSIRVVQGGFALSGVSLSGTAPYVKTVTFHPAPAEGTVEFAYRPAPVSEDISYLPVLLRAALLLGASQVVGVRVPGGNRASASWSGWSVTARAEGALYNGTRVQVYPDRVEVSVPNRPVRSYARPREELSLYYGMDEVTLVPPASGASWPSGLDVTLAGGYSATFNASSLIALANLWTPEIPGVVLVPAMGISPVCYTAAAAFGFRMESAGCCVVYCSSLERITSITR